MAKNNEKEEKQEKEELKKRAAGDVYPNIRGTLSDNFQIGKGGPDIQKDAADTASVRDSGGSLAKFKVALPSADDDAVPRSEIAGGKRTIEIPIGTTTPVLSTNTIPANATIHDADVDIGTAYDNSATIKVGTEGGPLATIMSETDNDPANIGLYHKRQRTAWGGSAKKVEITIGNAPTVGAGNVVVEYSVPNT